MELRKIVIAGAGGRDFHNFNVVYRNNPAYRVVAFTATQIPNIDGRKYPASLAGELYPNGIDIYPEDEIEQLISNFGVDEVVFSYSDVSHQYVMNFAARIVAAGVDFQLLGPNATMLKSKAPVISICAIRTGCGKSQTTRKVCDLLRRAGRRVVAVRHPMPYGDLARQRVQRFAELEDLDKHECTIEEREEYEPHIANGIIVYAGVDYAEILKQAEDEADIIVWDGGNNDFSFFMPSLEIVVFDPLRLGHEQTYYPGSVNLRRAHVGIINKVDQASDEDVLALRNSILRYNPSCVIIEAASPILVENGDAIHGKKVLCIEDGPTLTHGGMSFGAAFVAAKTYGAGEIVDPKPYAAGMLIDVYKTYPQSQRVLPAVGYGTQQIRDLEATVHATIDATGCDLVLIGTPIDLRRLIDFPKPAIRIAYELQEIGKPDLNMVLQNRGFIK